MRINYDFNDLETFLAVKETGSFQLAASRLNLSQSSVTRRIKKLEEALGTSLFERTTRDVRPTLAAKRLQLRAEAIVQDALETTRAMRDESAAYAYQRARTVTIASIPTVVDALVSPALRTFRARHSGVRLRLMDMAANEVAEAVAQGDADFGICSIPMLEPVTEFSLLLNEPLVLAMPADHSLTARDFVAWTELAEEDLILPARGTGNRLLIDEALARNSIPVRWKYQVGRSSTALDLVANGIGVAPLPQMALSGTHNKSVCWRIMKAPEVSRPIGLLSRIGHKDTVVAADLKLAISGAAPSQAKLSHG
ncbi:MAG: LysR family transcriptional regulator [Dinoroseobacter sp.]|nr:LysR family transcriptional regulator [Dinoroseobacter sp.]